MNDFIIKLLFKHKNGQIYIGEKNLVTNIYKIYVDDNQTIDINLSYSPPNKLKKLGFEFLSIYPKMISQQKH